ncbi:MAG: dimethylargininase [Pontimonas sp.]
MTIATQAATTHNSPQRDLLAPKSAQPKTVLMCRPDHFTVSYRINPWMFPENPTDQSLAARQWDALYNSYRRLGFDVHLIAPLQGLPDMVYAANGAFVLDGIAYEAKFRHPERQPEGPAYLRHLAHLGFDAREAVENNEGEGDILLVGQVILAAHGFRSESGSHREIAEVFGREVVSLRLINPSFYHLDTALAVLDDDTIAYLPSAFDEQSRAVLKKRYPDAIIATEQDAAVLGLNLFSDGLNVVMAEQARTLRVELDARGFNTHGVNLSELLLGGGGVKCCTLELRR